MYSCFRTASQYRKYFPSFSYFATSIITRLHYYYFNYYYTSLEASGIVIIAKYQKRGKYLSILHDTTCDNYFIFKCLLKSNVARFILLTYCIELA